MLHSIGSSSSFANESSINQTKVAKLVLKPQPVRAKAKIAIKNNQQSPSKKASLPTPSSQAAILCSSTNHNDKNRDQLLTQEKRDIELERAIAPKVDKEKKTLKLPQKQQQQQQQQEVKLLVAHKSKMDEAARCEARKFMRQQREKRKMEVKKEVDTAFIIKQRLDELRRSTKSAIEKPSMHKKQTTPKKKSPLKQSPFKDASYFSMDNNNMKEIRELKLKPMVAKSAEIEERKPSENANESTTAEQNIPTSPANNNNNILHPQNQLHLPSKRQSSQQQLSPARPCKENTKPEIIYHDDLQLKVPDLKLSMSHNRTEMLNITKPLSATAKTSVPFWLQSTNIQPYPYNFIWAVRKKLEAFTTTCDEKKFRHQKTQFELETPQLKRDKRLARGRKLPHDLSADEDDDDASETNTKSMEHEMPSEANTISEISSIKSDMVLPKSISHETQQPIKASKDDTSISESIFKSLSDDPFVGEKLVPDTNNFSLNTSEKRENFLSSTKHQKESQEVHFKKPLQSTAILNDLNNGNKVVDDEKEEEFRKMLLAFNKSLSHVVEVNHLLSAALVSKSASSSSSAVSIKTQQQQQSDESSTRKEYSSSFEKNIDSYDKSSSKISEMINTLVNNQKKSKPNDNDETSSIRTLIEESVKSETIEDPPVIYHEIAQELSSSTTKVTTTTTRTEIIHQKVSNDAVPAKEEHETTLNESRLINMFKLNESEISLIESATSVCSNVSNLYKPFKLISS